MFILYASNFSIKHPHSPNTLSVLNLHSTGMSYYGSDLYIGYIMSL